MGHDFALRTACRPPYVFQCIASLSKILFRGRFTCGAVRYAALLQPGEVHIIVCIITVLGSAGEEEGELRKESHSLQQILQALQGELDSLCADSILLYEKVEFLQSQAGRGCTGTALHVIIQIPRSQG
ncbi:hypothetical protein AAFF_G00370800 [Aldrovandia affinis]|uniref:Uncharacterized protein n=1 Tax=Aldrovandia affinis TaxID=143900 RepID=A0AAD7SGN8_9TELE|nr:hypothetical protein AAFF_G00370800 [Aldrovandia affinis]